MLFHDFPVILHDVSFKFRGMVGWWPFSLQLMGWWVRSNGRVSGELQMLVFSASSCNSPSDNLPFLTPQNPTTVVFQALNQANFVWMLEMLEISYPQKSCLPGWRICTLRSIRSNIPKLGQHVKEFSKYCEWFFTQKLMLLQLLLRKIALDFVARTIHLECWVFKSNMDPSQSMAQIWGINTTLKPSKWNVPHRIHAWYILPTFTIKINQM